MKKFGGMVSFTVKGDSMEDAFTVVSSMEVFTLAQALKSGQLQQVAQQVQSLDSADDGVQKEAG